MIKEEVTDGGVVRRHQGSQLLHEKNKSILNQNRFFPKNVLQNLVYVKNWFISSQEQPLLLIVPSIVPSVSFNHVSQEKFYA